MRRKPRDSSFGNSAAGNPGRFGVLSNLGLPKYDKFGLPLIWTAAETELEKADRFMAVMTLLREVYDSAVYQLDAKLAEFVWKQTIKGRVKSKVGRPKGRRKNPAQDAELLRLYDAWCSQVDEKKQGSIPRLLAKELKADRPKEFPSIVSSIETRIRRLIRERENERAARMEADRKWVAKQSSGFLLDLDTGIGAGAVNLALQGHGQRQSGHREVGGVKGDKNPV